MAKTTELNWQEAATEATDWESVLRHLFTKGCCQSRAVVEVHDEYGMNNIRLEPGLISYRIELSEEQYLWLHKNITNNPEG